MRHAQKMHTLSYTALHVANINSIIDPLCSYSRTEMRSSSSVYSGLRLRLNISSIREIFLTFISLNQINQIWNYTQTLDTNYMRPIFAG